MKNDKNTFMHYTIFRECDPNETSQCIRATDQDSRRAVSHSLGLIHGIK